MPGMTAYTGLLNIGAPQPGETVVVAAATGAVGSVVGQIAKIMGAPRGRHRRRRRQVPATSPKNSASTSASTTACRDFAERLHAACPDGIDVYFENVGGAVWEAVLPLLNSFARIPVCGLIAHYNDTAAPAGPDRVPTLMRAILTKRLTLRGFIVSDFATQAADFARDVGAGCARDASATARTWSTVSRTRPQPSSASSRAAISASS